MTRDDVMLWVEAYEHAWRAQHTDAMERLFTPSATYLRSPYDRPLVGQQAIKEFWVDDEEGPVFTMAARVVAVEGVDAVVHVKVEYGDPVHQEYLDLWVLRFADDGRVEHFEEWAYWPEKPFAVSDPPP